MLTLAVFLEKTRALIAVNNKLNLKLLNISLYVCLRNYIFLNNIRY